MPIPIFAPYTWQETESGVTISARIPGATPANTDFFASPHYVKANSSPGGGSGIFLLEADLLAEIDAKRSAAVVKAGGEVEIRLHKVAPELWGQLTVQALDKAERMRRRRRSIEAAERAAAADAEEAKKAAWEKSRHTLSSQMELDRAYRGVLEARKSAEKAHEEAELDAWQCCHRGWPPFQAAGHRAARLLPRRRHPSPPGPSVRAMRTTMRGRAADAPFAFSRTTRSMWITHLRR